MIPVPEFRYHMCRLGERIPEDECDEIVKVAADSDNPEKINVMRFARYLMGIREE